MPLLKGSSQAVISKNISFLMKKEKRSHAQAVAIAMRIAHPFRYVVFYGSTSAISRDGGGTTFSRHRKLKNARKSMRKLLKTFRETKNRHDLAYIWDFSKKVRHMSEEPKRRKKACKDCPEKAAKWSSNVKTKWKAPPGLFANGSAREIARTLMDGHRGNSKTAMSSLNYYINRAGKNLPSSRKRVLTLAKVKLEELAEMSKFNKRTKRVAKM